MPCCCITDWPDNGHEVAVRLDDCQAAYATAFHSELSVRETSKWYVFTSAGALAFAIVFLLAAITARSVVLETAADVLEVTAR